MEMQSMHIRWFFDRMKCNGFSYFAYVQVAVISFFLIFVYLLEEIFCLKGIIVNHCDAFTEIT